MGDLESLLLVLAAIYLSECVVWVRRGGVAFHSHRGKTWRFWHPGAVLGNARGAMFLANPIPPLGTVLVSHQFPVSFSPQGVISFTAACINPGWRPAQSANHLRYEEARTIAVEGRTLRVNGGLFVKAPSPAVARAQASLLRRLKSIPEIELCAWPERLWPPGCWRKLSPSAGAFTAPTGRSFRMAPKNDSPLS